MTSAPEELVPVPDGELCVQRFGDPARPTLVLVSGAAASMDWWDVELCERLAAGGRHVVRYDHRDTGRSTTGTPGEPAYGSDRLARDCEALLEAVGPGPVHLVGISMGGGIAQVVTLRRPELVGTLTLIATTAVGGVETPAAGGSLDSDPPAPTWSDPASYADWVIASERVVAGSISVDEPRLRALAETIHARSTDVAAAPNHWLVIGQPDDEDDDGDEEPLDVHRITAPTLVVHGSEDPLFPLPHGRVLADAIPGARLLVVPGMGHQVPPPTTWDVVVPALLEHTTGPIETLP